MLSSIIGQLDWPAALTVVATVAGAAIVASTLLLRKPRVMVESEARAVEYRAETERRERLARVDAKLITSHREGGGGPAYGGEA